MELLLEGRGLALCIGNCQTIEIKKIMARDLDFCKDYLFVSVPSVHLVTADKEQKMREFDFIFRKCKLCMTQVISDRNGYSVILSTNSVKKMLNKKARLLTIPTLYFDLYFPQTYAGGKITINNFEFYGFGYGDCILEELHSKYNVDEIVEITKCDQLFSKSFMKWFEEYRYQELKKREEFWDVKIVDWIFERYKTERLFYSHNHPMLKVILRVVSGIMKELGYTWDARLVEYDKSFLAGHQELIYPSVKKSLGLEFEIPYYEENDVLGICDFEGAVRNRLSYIYERGIL